MKYRILKKKEIVKVTDQFQRENGTWADLADCAIFEPNERVGGLIYRGRKYRRLVDIPDLNKIDGNDTETLKNCLRNSADVIVLLTNELKFQKRLKEIAKAQVKNIESCLIKSLE